MIFDIVLLVIALIFFIFGARKGFKNQVLNLIAIVASILVAVFLSNPVANLLLDTPVGSWAYKVPEKLLEGSGISDGVVFRTAESFTIQLADGSFVDGNKLSEMIKAPSMIKDTIIDSLQNGMIVRECIKRPVALYVLSAVCAVVMFILVFIIVEVLKILLRAKKKSSLLAIDRALGGIVALVYAFFIFLVLFAILNLTKSQNFLAPVYNQINSSYLSKWFYEQNLLTKLFSWVVKLFAGVK